MRLHDVGAVDLRRHGAAPVAVAIVAVLTALLPRPEAHGQTAAVTIAMGMFAGTDSAHRGEGTVLLIRLPDGRRFLRFERLKVTNGPDLYVYLSGHPAPRNRAQLHDAGAHEVALLKGNQGNQNYELPAGLDLGVFKSAVIYCKRFSVVFATAELKARP
jgi:hypothetical protein